MLRSCLKVSFWPKWKSSIFDFQRKRITAIQVIADGLLGGKKGLGATKSCSSLVETIRFGRREKNDLDHLAELLVGARRLEWGWGSVGTGQGVGDHRGHDGEADFVQLSITTCLNPLMGWGLKSGICRILLILKNFLHSWLSVTELVIVIKTINDHDIVAPEQDHDHVTKSIQIFL